MNIFDTGFTSIQKKIDKRVSEYESKLAKADKSIADTEKALEAAQSAVDAAIIEGNTDLYAKEKMTLQRQEDTLKAWKKERESIVSGGIWSQEEISAIANEITSKEDKRLQDTEKKISDLLMQIDDIFESADDYFAEGYELIRYLNSKQFIDPVRHDIFQFRRGTGSKLSNYINKHLRSGDYPDFAHRHYDGGSYRWVKDD